MKLNSISESYFKKKPNIELPWWLGDKDPPANEGDAGSITDLGRSHMPQNN